MADDPLAEAVTRSIANLWTWNALFTSHLLRSLRENGMPSAAIETLLQRVDADVEVLDGEDDRAYAVGLLATVRTLLRDGS